MNLKLATILLYLVIGVVVFTALDYSFGRPFGDWIHQIEKVFALVVISIALGLVVPKVIR